MNRRAFLSMIGLAPVGAVASILLTPSHAGISSFDAAAALDELETVMDGSVTWLSRGGYDLEAEAVEKNYRHLLAKMNGAQGTKP